MKTKISLAIVVLSVALQALLPVTIRANDIVVTNVALTSVNTSPGVAYVQFDIAWQNSWRVDAAPSNWDAAWVFVKYQGPDGVWRQAHLGTNDSDHVAPPGSTISVGMTGTNAVGIFIYRSTDGVGYVSWPAVQLMWNYGADEVSSSSLVTVDVCAIEMVYVPTGAFYLGDGYSPLAFQNGTNTTQPFYVSGSGPITIGTNSGQLWANDSISNTLAGQTTSIPNGYNGFYIMKYECTGDEMANFLAKTGRTEQPNAFFPVTGLYKPVVSSEPEVLAFLDWAGLRPMTEFEYEKACRGILNPVPGEYAWGSAIRSTTPYGITNINTSTENIGTGYQNNAGNTWDANTMGFGYAVNSEAESSSFGSSFPNFQASRVGIFALPAYSGTTPGRIQSGGSYYGVMDLTGNLGEPVYPVFNMFTNTSSTSVSLVGLKTQLVTYSGTEGDGTLTVTNNGWPTNTIVARGGGLDYNAYYYESGEVTWQLSGTTRAVSDRSVRVITQYPSTRIDLYGIRGVRSAP